MTEPQFPGDLGVSKGLKGVTIELEGAENTEVESARGLRATEGLEGIGIGLERVIFTC